MSTHPTLPEAGPDPAPRRGLRLSVIFEELRADAQVVEANFAARCGEEVAKPVAVAAAAAAAEQRSAAPAGDEAAAAIEHADASLSTGEAAPGGARKPRKRRRVRSNITIGEILDRTRQAGFGVLVALMAIVSLPLPGLSVPFGAAVAFGAIQMIIGWERPWMPRRIRAHAVSMRTLEWIGKNLAKYTRGLERLSRPRFTFMLRGPFWSLCGVGILILGVGLALPLPIPGSNLFFIVPIMIYAIGMLENDGLLIMAGHAATAAEIALAVAFWEIIDKAVRTALHWMGFA